MNSGSWRRLAEARAEAERLRKRALLARLESVRLFAVLDGTLLHVGMTRYLAGGSTSSAEVPGQRS